MTASSNSHAARVDDGPIGSFVALKLLHGAVDGLLIPVKVLLLSARGFTVADIGLAMAIFSLAIVLFELPTGGFADAWGRRRVLVLATCINLTGILVFGLASASALLLSGIVLTGIARSLASGPLEAWFVDAARERNRTNDLSRGLGRGASAENVGMAVGALTGGAIPLLFDHLESSGDGLILSLSTTFVAAAALTIIELVAILLTVDNGRAVSRPVEALRQVPDNIRRGLAIANQDGAFRSILVRLFLAGVAVSAFDIFVPLRLVQLGMSSEAATGAFGLLAMASFLGSAATALVAPRLRRQGPPLAVAGLTAVMAGALGLLSATPLIALVLAGYFFTRTVNGPVMPILGAEMHDRVATEVRTTLVSVLSLAAMLGAVVGSVTLTRIVDAESDPVLPLVLGSLALVAGGLALVRNGSAWHEHGASRVPRSPY